MEMFQNNSIEIEEVSLVPIISNPENIVIKKQHETMMQIAAQWLEYRSPVSNVDDVDNSLIELPDPQLPGEEVLLLTPELRTYHLATMNPIPLPSEVISRKTSKKKEVGQRNLLPLPNTARASLRYELSSTETAAVASSFLLDLIEGGVLSKEFSYLAVDKCKIQRWRSQVMSQDNESAYILCTELQ